MTGPRMTRVMKLLVPGVILLQAGGCASFTTINDIIQTILLGITAAGGLAILQNI